MKNTITKILTRGFIYFRKHSDIDYIIRQEKCGSSSQITQKLLAANYRKESVIQSFEDIGFSVYSEFNEDGILLYIFSLIGIKNRKLVEIGCGAGPQNNSSNLLINHHWNGVLIDYDTDNCNSAKNFYNQHSSTKLLPPNIINTKITPDNVNGTLEPFFRGGEQIDFLSLDIDSIDLWVLEALELVCPRVIVVEINARWGAEDSKTFPNDTDANPVFSAKYGMIFAGASLLAFCKLMETKGYYLVGTNHTSTNAFFIARSEIHHLLPEVSIESVLSKPRAMYIYNLCKAKLQEFPWVDYKTKSLEE